MTIFERTISVLAAVVCLQATTVHAATFAVDFQGVATSRSGDFASETATGNQVTGSIFIDDDLPFVTSANPFGVGVAPGSIDRMLQAITNPSLPGNLAATVTFGSLTRGLSTDPALNPISSPAGQIDIRAIDDNPFGADDTFSVSLVHSGGGERFDFQLNAEDMIGLDPSLGFSMALLQSIDLAAVTSTSIPGTSKHASLSTQTGSIVFSVTSLNVRQVTPTTVGPGATAVPLPAGLPVLLTGLGMLGLVRRNRRV